MTSGQPTPVRVVGRSNVASAQRAYRGGIVARDTASGEILLASDHPRQWWIEHGRDGTRSYSCVDCVAVGDPEPWLLYARGNVQRPHFRHYRCLDDGSEPTHGSETSWHLEAKRLLAEWARTEAVTLAVRQEVSVRAGSNGRRADVLVEGDGWRTAFEAQHSYLGAMDWSGRHGDYQSAGINDVWLFAPANEPHLGAEINLTSLTCFILDLEAREVGMLVVAGVKLPYDWWRPDDDLLPYVDHLAEAGERWTEVAYVALDACHLDAEGRFELVHTRLNLGDVTKLEAERSRLREKDREIQARRHTAIREARERLRAQRDVVPSVVESSRPICVLCGYPMDPDVYQDSDHHLPEMRCSDSR